jgi:hypothetical protein
MPLGKGPGAGERAERYPTHTPHSCQLCLPRQANHPALSAKCNAVGALLGLPNWRGSYFHILSETVLRHDLVGSPALAGVARHDLIGSSALAGVAWKDFIATAHVTVIRVIVTATHAMMINVFVTITVHAVAIIMMAVALHVVVIAVMPGKASTSSVCLGQRCRASDKNYCPQASQKFTGFDHFPPSRVAT